MKFALLVMLIAAAAPAQMQRAGFATGYMYSYYIPQSASTPWRPAWSPDGTELAFAMSGSIWKIAPGDTTAYELTANATYDSSPAWSPDGRFLVYTAEDSDGVNLMLMNVATRESTVLTRGSNIHTDPVFSPDGKSIAFVKSIQSPRGTAATAPAGFHVYTMPFDNGKTGSPVQITEQNSFGRARLYFSPADDHISPHWSPDGKELMLV